jgi:hypothetical protein
MYRKRITKEVSRMRRNIKSKRIGLCNRKRIAESDLRMNGEKKKSYVQRGIRIKKSRIKEFQ